MMARELTGIYHQTTVKRTYGKFVYKSSLIWENRFPSIMNNWMIDERLTPEWNGLGKHYKCQAGLCKRRVQGGQMVNKELVPSSYPPHPDGFWVLITYPAVPLCSSRGHSRLSTSDWTWLSTAGVLLKIYLPAGFSPNSALTYLTIIQVQINQTKTTNDTNVDFSGIYRERWYLKMPCLVENGHIL